MATHVNFYENVKEAGIRLNQTVILYDKKPYNVLSISAHKPDGLIRLYIDDLTDPRGPAMSRIAGIPYNWYDEGPGGKMAGDVMDEWMAKNPNSGIIRKRMSSPFFNRFRPFELGMCNYDGEVVYLERRPMRITQQGLCQNMVSNTRVRLGNAGGPGPQVPITSKYMASTIVGSYPTVGDVLNNLKKADATARGAAFHRHFAIIRGPINTLYLAYKHDVIGILPEGNLSSVLIDKKFAYTKEVVSELGLFQKIEITK